MNRISFDLEEFREFLDEWGGYYDSGVLRLENNEIVYRWTSYLNGIWKENKDVELVGKIVQ